MKKFLSLFVLAAFLIVSCDKYDDTDLKNRISTLENSVSELTTYQALLQKINSGKTVTAYASGSDGTYTLTFSDGSSITFNAKGEPGANGTNGTNGTNGEDGKTPTFKIEGETWYVSYDEGATWKSVGSAIDRSLISGITADGSTLNITLADGTVVPLFYGEKEVYDLDIAGGRKVFCALEKQEFYLGPNWDYLYVDIPYTLTGDLASADDVQFSVRATSESQEVNLYGRVTVNPTDAKSGTIRVVQSPVYDTEYTYGFSEDGFFWKDWPGIDVEVVAYFPDHSSVFKSFKVLPIELGMQLHDDSNGDYAFEYDGYNPVIRLENTSGIVKLTLWASIYGDYKSYDGDPIPSLSFDEMFKKSTSRPAANDLFIAPTLISSDTLERENYWERTFVINVPFSANTTGSERYNDFSVTKKTTTGYYPLFKLRFQQAK